MAEREQRTVRKIWKVKTKKHRDRLKLQSTRNYLVTPPASDNEDQLPLPHNNIALAAEDILDTKTKKNHRVRKYTKIT